MIDPKSHVFYKVVGAGLEIVPFRCVSNGWNVRLHIPSHELWPKREPNGGTSFEVGQIYAMDAKPKVGKAGFHCYRTFTECFHRSEIKKDCRYLMVQLGTDVVQEDGVFCSNEMHVIEEMDPMKAEKNIFQAVSENGRLISKIPENMRTPEMCLAAVSENPWMLDRVPKHMRTPEMCLIAVSKRCQALGNVPNNLKTPEMCLKAVSCFREESCVLLFVPETMRTPEVCLAAVSQNGRELQWVPDNMITPEICHAAVLNNAYVLPDIPESMKTPEMCGAAVSLDPQLLSFVPISMRTHDVCIKAVSGNLLMLEWVPENIRKEIVCVVQKAPE